MKKTEVPTTNTALQVSMPIKTSEESDKHCSLHNKPYPLFNCCTFRSKHLDDGKAYLKEKSNWYRCCASTEHIAKDCNVSVKCKECGSNKHISALHPGPAPWTNLTPGGEPEQNIESVSDVPVHVTSKCTEIRGDTLQPRSCYKICWVSVYHPHCANGTKCACAVLNEQSNKLLAKSQFFELFRLEVDASPYTLRTCSGIVERVGRKNWKIAASVEDSIFLNTMKKEMYIDEENHCVAPLPFHSPQRQLPNNKGQAMQ